MNFEDVVTLKEELDINMELVKTYCSEEEMNYMSWEELVDLAKDRDDEAAQELENDILGMEDENYG